MSRPKRRRMMANPPKIEGFRPFGVPMTNIEPVVLLFEEYESMRLADYEGLTQEQAAEKMGISRPTFTRIYDKARKTIAEAFVEGKAVIIQGGDFHTDDYWYRCQDCNRPTVSKEKIEKCCHCGSKQIHSLSHSCTEMDCKGWTCICMNCDTEIIHERGKPCREHVCPKCQSGMIRKGSYHHQLYLKSKGAK